MPSSDSDTYSDTTGFACHRDLPAAAAGSMGDTSGRQLKEADLEEGDVSAAGLTDADEEEDQQHDEDEDEDLLMLARPEVRLVLPIIHLSGASSEASVLRTAFNVTQLCWTDGADLIPALYFA